MPSPVRIGQGRYRVLGVLGSGGSATVFRVMDEKLKVERAVKVVTFALPSLRDRLRQEAQLMARLSNPHILPVHDLGADGDADFVVMEIAEGGSLQERLERLGPLPPADAVEATLQLLSALGAAHAAGTDEQHC